MVIEKELARSAALKTEGDSHNAMSALLNAQTHIDNTTPLRLKLDVYTQLGAAFYDVHKLEDAQRFFLKSVDEARSFDSISRHPELLWNLVLTVNNSDFVKQILTECRDICDGDIDFRSLGLRSRIALSKVYVMEGDARTAKEILDSIPASSLSDYILRTEVLMQQATIDLANKDFDSGIAILEKFNKDSLSLDGNVDRFYLISQAYREKGDYHSALTYRDSLTSCLDSIQSMRMSESINKVESEYNERIEKGKSERKTIIIVGIAVVLSLLIFVLLLNRSRRLKERQIALVNQISLLNLRLSSLQEKPDTELSEESVAERVNALTSKLTLNKELFMSLPQFSLVTQANLERNAEDIPKNKQKDIVDTIIAIFSDVCNNLKEEYPTLSSDDMLLGIMSLLGLNKEVISTLLKSSDDALRQRKSRMKKKVSPEIFELFFSK